MALPCGPSGLSPDGPFELSAEVDADVVAILPDGRRLLVVHEDGTVFVRDGYACRTCGFASTPRRAEDELDAHHITDRNEMPNGGYVAEKADDRG